MSFVPSAMPSPRFIIEGGRYERGEGGGGGGKEGGKVEEGGGELKRMRQFSNWGAK